MPLKHSKSDKAFKENIKVEVKAGKDRMSDFQKMRKQEIQIAGGIYFECKSTDGFLAFWQNLKEEMK